jgi:hypothetical protein
MQLSQTTRMFGTECLRQFLTAFFPEFLNALFLSRLSMTGICTSHPVPFDQKTAAVAEAAPLRATHSMSEPVRAVLLRTATDFVLNGYRALMGAVFRSVQLRQPGVTPEDRTNYMRVSAFFLEFHRLFMRRRAESIASAAASMPPPPPPPPPPPSSSANLPSHPPSSAESSSSSPNAAAIQQQPMPPPPPPGPHSAFAYTAPAPPTVLESSSSSSASSSSSTASSSSSSSSAPAAAPAPAAGTQYDASIIFLNLNLESFTWVVANIRLYVDEEKKNAVWRSVLGCVNLYRQMMMCIYEMTTRGDADNRQVCSCAHDCVFGARAFVWVCICSG